MKYLLALAATLSLVSCNTSIGLWRDSVKAYDWTKSKIQGNNDPYGSQTEYGAPVY